MKNQEDDCQRDGGASAPSSTAPHSRAALRQKSASGMFHFHSVVMDFFLKSHDPDVQLPSNKLDYTCVVEIIFLTVKSDHVFLAHCDNKPEEFS